MASMSWVSLFAGEQDGKGHAGGSRLCKGTGSRRADTGSSSSDPPCLPTWTYSLVDEISVELRQLINFFLILRPCRLTGTGGSSEGSRESNDLTGMGKLNGAFNGLQTLTVFTSPARGRGRGREGVTGIQLQRKSLWNEVHWYSLVRKNSWENLFISLCQNPSNPEDVVKFSEIESGGIHILTILTESSVRQCPYTHLHTCVPQKSRKYTHRYFNWRKASWFDIFILNLQSVIPKVDDTINITYEILNSFPLCSIYETQFFSSRRLHYMAIVPRMSGTIMYATPLDSARFAIPAIFSRN